MVVRRRFGQHFLTDGGAAERIVAAAAVTPHDAVLEIGPGRGALTSRLVGAAGRIAAIEIDPRLAEGLSARFPPERLLLIRDDVLRVPFAEVLERMGRAGERLVIVSNLPYDVSKPVADKLVRERSSVERAVLMFQREVAERLTARPGKRSYGPATVLGGFVYRIEEVFSLGPGAFRPPPKVTSTVTRWRRLDEPIDLPTELRLRRTLELCFAHRRRTLRNNLRAAFASDLEVERVLADARIEGRLRAEQLAPTDFLRLASALTVV